MTDLELLIKFYEEMRKTEIAGDTHHRDYKKHIDEALRLKAEILKRMEKKNV